MEKIVNLAKVRGFVYSGSEIYGGLANTWDYGNLGVELKNNVKKAWWKKFIQESPYNVGVDCAILMIPQTWVELSNEDDIKKLNRILDLLDEDDDVQAVYHNWDE